MIAFIHYIAFLGACLFAGLLLSKGQPLAFIVAAILGEQKQSIRYFDCAVAWVIATWFVYVLLLLKSFIWNLYQSILILISVEPELERSNSSE
jgi:hypothetical protein